MLDPQDTIVLLEDSNELGELTRDVLQYEGFDVHLAKDGDEALRLCAQIAPSLVLLDVNVPGLRGQKLVDALRSLPVPAPPEIVAVTGGGEPLEHISERLQKPFEIHELIALVRRYCRPRERTRTVILSEAPL